MVSETFVTFLSEWKMFVFLTQTISLLLQLYSNIRIYEAKWRWLLSSQDEKNKSKVDGQGKEKFVYFLVVLCLKYGQTRGDLCLVYLDCFSYDPNRQIKFSKKIDDQVSHSFLLFFVWLFQNNCFNSKKMGEIFQTFPAS